MIERLPLDSLARDNRQRAFAIQLRMRDAIRFMALTGWDLIIRGEARRHRVARPARAGSLDCEESRALPAGVPAAMVSDCELEA